MILILMIGAALAVLPAASAHARVEEPAFTLVAKEGAFEIRDYAPMIVAEVAVTGEREKAINDGFRVLADFIFGNNEPQAEIAMTAPVVQERATIAMTAPVLQEGGGEARWTVRFVMPASYTLETLPRPADPRITIRALQGERMALLRFSGFGSQQALARRSEELASALSARGLEPASPPIFAFYDPPWTLPFLRRNEVMVRLALP